MPVYGHLTWEHIGEGIIIGVGIAAVVATARILGATQRRIRREHHQLLHWARRVGWKTGIRFPLEHDRNHDDEDDWEEGLT